MNINLAILIEYYFVDICNKCTEYTFGHLSIDHNEDIFHWKLLTDWTTDWQWFALYKSHLSLGQMNSVKKEINPLVGIFDQKLLTDWLTMNCSIQIMYISWSNEFGQKRNRSLRRYIWSKIIDRLTDNNLLYTNHVYLLVKWIRSKK